MKRDADCGYRVCRRFSRQIAPKPASLLGFKCSNPKRPLFAPSSAVCLEMTTLSETPRRQLARAEQSVHAAGSFKHTSRRCLLPTHPFESRGRTALNFVSFFASWLPARGFGALIHGCRIRFWRPLCFQSFKPLVGPSGSSFCVQ